MRFIKVFLFVLTGIILPVSLSAQTVSGKLIDENSQPLPYANVVLLSLPDSAFVNGTISGEDGSFTLEATSENQIVKISSIGYKTVCKPVSPANIGIVQLVSDAQMLGEVLVKGNLPVTRMKGDAMVTSVENSVLSKVGSANDVLTKIPGITKKQDAFEVFGKGVPLIYINGRKLHDLSELEQLNSDDIKSVEVIRNPGSRYDATVKAVVRIQTVKRQGDGFGFNLRSSYYQSDNTDLIEQANFNYRHNNLDIFGSVYYNQMESWQDFTLQLEERGTKVWNHDMKSYGEFYSKMLSGNIGFNYQLNDNHAFGMKYKSGKTLNERNPLSKETNINVDNVFYDNIKVNSCDNYYYDPDHELNAYYNGQFDDVNIDFNADYLQNGKSSNSVFQEISQTSENRDVHSVNNVRNRLVAGKLTLSLPLGGGTFAVGSEVTYTHRNDDYINEENYVPTSYSKIEELNATGYAEYNRSFPWGDWSLGLRYEHVKFDYYEDGKHIDEQSRTFDNFFPNITFSKRLGKVQTQLSYTAKTQRPTYSELSNNVFYSDRFTLQKGNPTLRPTIIHDLTLSGAWRFLQMLLSYSQTKDWILNWGELVNEDASLTMLSKRNWDKSIPMFTAFLSASPKIGCWSPMMSVGMQKQWLSVDYFKETKSLDHPLFIASFSNTWELPLGLMIGLDSYIQSAGATQNIYSEKPNGYVNVSVRKSFLNDALSVELRGNDIFNTNKISYSMYSGDYYLYQKSAWDRQEFAVTVRYKFNTAKSKYKGTGAGDSQKNRM
ncbi:outer membrane beta-barrel protein [uncultured Bacteroides sp.]|uniref:outer membrane beta-barrel protein n=1 Tax=uncultured Bacteroides sp. TaxID=162156 RepID=UPI0027D9362A|nr:outer membrane beta-barrel protein [uncultured Bacteroides sp.]